MAQVTLVWNYHNDGSFELIIQDPETFKTVTLTGKASKKDLEFISNMLPPYVFVTWNDECLKTKKP